MPTIAANTLAFPFNQRWSMVFWSLLFNADTAFRAQHRAERGMEPRRLSRRSAGALRRVPHAAQSCFRPRQSQEIRRRADRRLEGLQHHLRQGNRHRRLERRRIVDYLAHRPCGGPRHGGRSDGRSRRPELQPDGAGGYPRGGQPICAAFRRSTSSEPATIAPPAPASPSKGGAVADLRRQDESSKGPAPVATTGRA